MTTISTIFSMLSNSLLRILFIVRSNMKLAPSLASMLVPNPKRLPSVVSFPNIVNVIQVQAFFLKNQKRECLRRYLMNRNEEYAFHWFSSIAEADEKVSSWVTTLSQCQTDFAKHLCISSPNTTLSRESELSIGGTFKNDRKDFWFFCTTTLCHGTNSLLNLFVITRTDNRFSLTLPKNGHDLTNQIKVNAKWSEITGPTKKYHFATSRKDELFFVKTYCFTKEDLQKLREYPLLLPCAIEVTASYRVHPDIVNRFKLQYTDQANAALYNTRHEGDFVIESRSRTKYPVHLVVAAAHSSILREEIKRNKKSYFIDLHDEDVEILIEFLYKGSIENMSVGNAPNIIKLAHEMGLPGLLELGIMVLSAEINADNAVELAVLAKKYDLQDLLLKVLDYIKQNPKLLFSSSIESLEDVDLMRRMLQHIGNVSSECKFGCVCDKCL